MHTVPTDTLRSTASIRVLVVDSSFITRQAISSALQQNGFHVESTEPNFNDVLNLAERKQVDVALISGDIGPQPTSGCELVEKLRSVIPRLQIIMVLEHPDREATINAFRAGARGLFCRSNSLEVLWKCIACVHEGQVWASSTDQEHLISALRMPLRLKNATGADLLSKRERDVVHLATEGLTNREIAGQLGLSENTVKNYLFRVFDKLGISSRVELVLYAVSQLIDVPGNSGSRAPRNFNGDAKMFQWCREVAEKFTVVQHALGEMYRDGRGVPRDSEAAYMWFSIAEKLSSGAASISSVAKGQLELELRPELVERARRQAAEWLARHHGASSSLSLVPQSLTRPANQSDSNSAKRLRVS